MANLLSLSAGQLTFWLGLFLHPLESAKFEKFGKAVGA